MENRLSAVRRTQPAATGDVESRATIECLFLSTAASPARIRSSLLLKTASSDMPRSSRGQSLLVLSSIAGPISLGNVLLGGSGRRLDWRKPRNLRRTFVHRGKDEPVIPPETFSAAHWLQQKQGKHVTFCDRATARAETYFTTAIPAPIGLSEPRIGGTSHRLAPHQELRRKGADKTSQIFYTMRRRDLNYAFG
jgi:hypothetical protein